MAYATWDLGDPVGLSIEIRDAAGALANAGAVTITITKPDGTVLAPVGVSPTSTGIYEYTYLSLDVGRHIAKWIATGANAGVFSDIFNIRGADTSIISLADARAQINASATTNNEEIRSLIRAVTDVIEKYCGPVARRTVTENYSNEWQTAITLRSFPVISITSVTENGTALTADAYAVDDYGLLHRKAGGYYSTYWMSGVNNIQVTYVAGRNEIPPAIIQAAKILLGMTWQNQRGSTPQTQTERFQVLVQPALMQGELSDFGLPLEVRQILMPYMIPGIS